MSPTIDEVTSPLNGQEHSGLDSSEESITVGGSERNNELHRSAANLGNSIRNIGVAIDGRFEIRTKAKKIDEKIKINDFVNSTTRSMLSLLERVDTEYNVANKTRATGKCIDEKLKVSEVAGKIGRSVMAFDENHRVSTRTIGVLESGAGLIESKIVGAPSDSSGVGGGK